MYFRSLNLSKFAKCFEFPLRIWIMEKQNNTIMHSHDYCEIAIVTAGRGTQQFYGNESIKAEKGDVFIIPNGTVHAYANVNRMSIANVLLAAGRIPIPELDLGSFTAFKYFAKTKIQKSCSSGEFLYLKLNKTELGKVLRLIKEIYSEQSSERQGCDFACYGLLIELISVICRCEYLCGKVEERPKYMDSAVEAVSKSLDHARPLCDLAKEAGLSERSLRRQFKKAAGMAPSKYLMTQRLSKGAGLLLSTELPVCEIAVQCGFCDSSYFTLQFRRAMGVTPKAYRKRQKDMKDKQNAL